MRRPIIERRSNISMRKQIDFLLQAPASFTREDLAKCMCAIGVPVRVALSALRRRNQ